MSRYVCLFGICLVGVMLLRPKVVRSISVRDYYGLPR